MRLRKLWIAFAGAAAFAGCSGMGLFGGPKGPQTVTLMFSNETIGELKPCG